MRLLIKVGGTLVDDAGQRDAVARQIAAAHREGHAVVVVHGGGRQLTKFLEERGIESRFVNGLRVTTAEAVDAVLKVLAGTVNKQLVGALNAAGANAVGLSGMDGRLTSAVQMSAELGMVGRVREVDPSLMNLLIGAGYLPVIACVAGDEEGRAWNINADQMAIACALAFRAEMLIFLTDVTGVMDAEGHVQAALTTAEARALIEKEVARGGMRAKLEAASAAVEGGVGAVVIAPGAALGVVAAVISGNSTGTAIKGVN